MISTGRTVLVVEDDPQVRRLMRHVLSGDGYKVIEAGTGLEGLKLAQEHDNEIDLLLTDMLLPELAGIDLAAQVAEHYPKIKILFTTGYVEGDIVQRGMAELNAGFIDKPFQPAELLQRVREMLAAPAPQ